MLQFSLLNTPTAKKRSKKMSRKKVASFQIVSRRIHNSKYRHKPYGKCHMRIKGLIRRKRKKSK